MKNPFPHKLMVYSLQDGRIVNAGAGGEFTQEQTDYIAYVFNQHDKLVEFCRRVASFGFSFDSRDQANGAYRDAVRWLVQDAATLLDED